MFKSPTIHKYLIVYSNLEISNKGIVNRTYRFHRIFYIEDLFLNIIFNPGGIKPGQQRHRSGIFQPVPSKEIVEETASALFLRS